MTKDASLTDEDVSHMTSWLQLFDCGEGAAETSGAQWLGVKISTITNTIQARTSWKSVLPLK